MALFGGFGKGGGDIGEGVVRVEVSRLVVGMV
jgi:hypothetical protein